MRALILFGRDIVSRLSPFSDWHTEVHQFRIQAVAGSPSAPPTPEGRHRDGVSFALMFMIDHSNMTGGESTIYGLDGGHLARYQLSIPLDFLIVNDERVFHDVTNIVPADPTAPCYRDMLVVTFRFIQADRDVLP